MNWNERYILIDLTQEIYEGMPVFGMHQKTFIMKNQTHEQNMKNTGSKTLGFSARNLLISEHGPTHSDAVWEFLPSGPTIDNMDLRLFYGDAICVDLTHIRYPDYIEIRDLQKALEKANLNIRKGDIFLIYTGHYERTHPTIHSEDDEVDLLNYGGLYSKHTGLSYEAAKWLAEQGVVNIGCDAPAIDLTPDDLNYSGHLVCGQYGITNTENLMNLHMVAGKRFLYMGLPLRIRNGSGSPIRAVAIIER
ncbi:cyclase family protein [Neofamilia massiliensis]|uniref:cyclase family protein n=1 Tax=Neofamilia massiliensis TaxID=1673724 RepID=UPI00096AD6AF|nr:cyclase family protein [Neofamilia massiliensis]